MSLLAIELRKAKPRNVKRLAKYHGVSTSMSYDDLAFYLAFVACQRGPK